MRRIIISSGCAECASPRHSAHPIARSAHLEMRTLLTFGCGCGPRASSDPVGSLSYYHQLTNFHNSMPQRRIIKPSGCAKRACLKHSAHPLGLSAHFEMRKLLTFCLVVELGVRLTSWVLPPITRSQISIPRCPSVASLYRVDAPKAPVLRIKRIYMRGRRISKCENNWLFYV
jgi:hypothetical protein